MPRHPVCLAYTSAQVQACGISEASGVSGQTTKIAVRDIDA